MKTTKTERKVCRWLLLIVWNMETWEPIHCRWNDWIFEKCNKLMTEEEFNSFMERMIEDHLKES